MNLIEEWRPVVGFEGLYEVSNLGRVKSLARRVAKRDRWGNPGFMHCPERILANGPHTSGYVSVHLYKNGERRATLLHIIVAEAFCGTKPTPAHEVRHLDGHKPNCTASNLDWGTRLENEADKDLHGTRLRGEANGSAKLTAEQVLAIRRQRGVPQQELADIYGCTFSNISAIQRGKSWRHV